jgi:hypothetical protein
LIFEPGDKLNLDIFWLKDESLEDSANLAGLSSLPASLDTLEVSVPPAVKLQPHFCAQPTLDPDIIAAEIVEDLQAALAQFAEWSEWDERHRR